MHQIGCVPFKAGSIVFPRVGAALLNNNKKLLAQDSIVDDNVLVLSVTNANVCVNEFIYYALQNIRLEDWCNSGLVPVINSKTVYKHTMHLPSVREQQKIVEILTTQDKVIELKEKLLTEKRRQKKYLMQQLLTGKKRLPGFDDEWKQAKLGKLFAERSETNFEHLGLLAITGTQGVVPRSRLDLKDNSSEDKSKYLHICVGDIGYNTMRMWQGVSACSNYEGIVSPAYTILKPKGNINAKHFAYLFKMVMLAKYILMELSACNPRVVIVTDRKELDGQIAATFSHTRLNPARATSGRHLVELAEGAKADVITSIINKFNTAERMEIMNYSKDVFVLVDESHRSNYGLMATKMRSVFPNACYIGFTGTPLMKNDKNTMAKFGKLIHKYTIKDGVEDGAIVPLIYEGRFVEQKVDEENIDLWFRQTTKRLTEPQKEDLRKKWSSIRRLTSTDARIKRIALDISEHFVDGYQKTGFLSMMMPDWKERKALLERTMLY